MCVLGGGAPHASLMAGALAYIYQQKKTFDIFFTSGGGALIGLLFVAAKGKPPDEALRDMVEFGIDERIYKLFPVGYKTFLKDSPYTQQFHDWANRLKLSVEPRPFPGKQPPEGYDPTEQRRRRFFNDVIDFWAAALTPPRIGPTNRGLCAHLPFLGDMVDFDLANRDKPPSGQDLSVKVWRTFDPPSYIELKLGWFYVNAYNLDRKGIEQFSNEEQDLCAEHIRAALSFPLVYPPEKVGNYRYCEGADVDPLNLPNIASVIDSEVQEAAGRKAGRAARKAVIESLQPQPGTPDAPALTLKIYLFDILGALEKELIYVPRDLWEAYGLSILTPVVSLAKMSKEIFKRNPDTKGLELIEVPFSIPAKRSQGPLDWSYTNTTALWDEGWKVGKKFIDKHGADLPDRVDPPPGDADQAP